MEAGSAEAHQTQQAEAQAAAGGGTDAGSATTFPLLPTASCSPRARGGGGAEYEPSGLCGILRVDERRVAALGEQAHEQAGEPEPTEAGYPRVVLRLKYPVVCTHGGEIIPSASISSAAPLAVVSGELASMRKDLNKVRVERSKERRDFEASVRRYKAAVKTNHREIEKRLSGAQAAATWMEKLHNDSKKHAAWWRKQAHAQAKEMKLLRAELAESRVSGSQQAAAANQAESDLSRQAWVVGKLTARLESEKSAYRQRAAKERQQKQMAKKIGTLQEAAAAAKAEAEAMRSAAAAAQAELSEMGRELVQAKELQQALQQSLEAEAHKAHEAQQLAQQAEVEKEAEQERAASVVAARDALAGELAHVRE